MDLRVFIAVGFFLQSCFVDHLFKLIGKAILSQWSFSSTILWTFFSFGSSSYILAG